MTTKAELIAEQLVNGEINRRTWGEILYIATAYGVVGGGVVDDTAALQALVDKAIAEGRKLIFFPHGTYKVTALTNADKVVFVGDNASFTGGYAGMIEQLGSPGIKKGELVFNVKDYRLAAEADYTGAIARAVSAASAIGGIVQFPPGTYDYTDFPTVPSFVSIRGSGIDATTLRINSQTKNGMQITGYFSLISDLTIANVSPTVTAGSGIKMSDSTEASFERVKIYGFFYGVDVESGGQWNIDNCYIFSNKKYQIYIRNTVNYDGGDQNITGCTIDGIYTGNTHSDACIRHESGGGLRLFGNKLFRGNYGYDLQAADTVTQGTSVLLIGLNSIEGQRFGAIRLGRSGTTGSYGLISILGNEHNIINGADASYSAYIIGDGLNDIAISGNTFYGETNKKAIQINGSTGISVDGNAFHNWNTGISIGANATDVTLGQNVMKSVATTVEDNSQVYNNVDAGREMFKSVGGLTSTTAYTNLFRLDLPNYRSCMVELFIEGVLSGANVVGRYVKAIVTRGSGGCTVQNASDVASGSVIDIQMDVATVNGSLLVGVRRNAAAGGTGLDFTATLKIDGKVTKSTYL